jgi:hypothetical protein
VIRDGASDARDCEMNENGRLVPHGNRPEDYLTDVLAGRANDFIH